jgi:hypothetical protein
LLHGFPSSRLQAGFRVCWLSGCVRFIPQSFAIIQVGLLLEHREGQLRSSSIDVEDFEEDYINAMDW